MTNQENIINLKSYAIEIGLSISYHSGQDIDLNHVLVTGNVNVRIYRNFTYLETLIEFTRKIKAKIDSDEQADAKSFMDSNF